MIWGTIKLSVFLGLATLVGVLCATVPVGGKTVAARAAELWSKPEVKHAVGDVEERVKRGVEAATGSRSDRAPAPAPRGAREHARHEASAAMVRPTLAASSAKARPEDAYRPSEREAVARLIEARAR